MVFSRAAFDSEMNVKQQRIYQFLDEQKLDAVAFSTQSNFAWATCGGGNYVSTATDTGSAAAVFTRSGKRYAVCDVIEAPRIFEEELEGKGFEIISYPWNEPFPAAKIREIGGEKVGFDLGLDGMANIDSLFAQHRYSLTAEEVARYKTAGQIAAACVDETCREIKPGMTEFEIAALVDSKLIAKGMIPNVTLIAADERIEKFRHPVPTGKRLERYAMVVVGARKWGLIVSLTRLVHFGKIPDELRMKHKAVTAVDAVYLANTVPGVAAGDIFDKGLSMYAETGFRDEWKKHHQGGPTGYRGREYRASSGVKDTVRENQAWAWNPSITGTKSEDTIIAGSDGFETVSEIQGWPYIEAEINGRIIRRPDILEIR